jgi:UDPglucose 6-dehydrogenase
MKVTVFGTGYVGLVTGACLSEMGNHVLCLDLDARKVQLLNDGGVPIHEPGLEAIIQRNVAAHRLEFSTDVERGVAHGTILFIAVGTPTAADGAADLQQVMVVAREIGQHLNDYKVVVDKSTVPVGTAAQVREVIVQALAARGASCDFAVLSNPEFLKEGSAVNDFMRPDRVIIGSDDERAVLLMRSLYAPYVRARERLLVMDVASAEFTKYAANAMLATRISFMNELALLAEVVGADIESVRQGIGSDPRIGHQFLYAGCGYGGSCFPKDVRALMHTAEQAGQSLRVLQSVAAANDAQKQVLMRNIERRFGTDLKGRHFALWGLAFKPETDDMREAPSVALIDSLLAAGATVCAYDPVAMPEAQRCLGRRTGLSYAPAAMLALEGADALAIVTEWKEFKSPDFDAIVRLLRSPVVFDGRNLFDPELMKLQGIEYRGIGRARALAA